MNHPIHFVSLGPGDPELITLKGLNTLQKADISGDGYIESY